MKRDSTSLWLNQLNTQNNKKLLFDHLNKTKKISMDQLTIIHSEQFDAILYGLKSTVKIEVEKSTYFSIDSNQRFLNEEQLESDLKSCFNCEGKKYLFCEECNYLTPEQFTKCLYHEPTEKCFNCYQLFEDLKQKEICESCNNMIFIKCTRCKGLGRLKRVKLKQDIKKILDDVIIICKDNSIPFKKLIQSKGILLVEESMKKLNPISNYPDQNVHEKCKQLLINHNEKIKCSNSWELINQSHQLVAIPITFCKARLKKEIISFYVIGEDSEIYLPEKKFCSIS